MKESKLTKSDVIDEIYEKINMSKKDISAVTEALFSVLKKNLVEKKAIELRGFGTFDVVQRKGRENARNPQTGETVRVPDHHAVKFRPGKEIKEALK